jgi:hypothetical protein
MNDGVLIVPKEAPTSEDEDQDPLAAHINDRAPTAQHSNCSYSSTSNCRANQLLLPDNRQNKLMDKQNTFINALATPRAI